MTGTTAKPTSSANSTSPVVKNKKGKHTDLEEAPVGVARQQTEIPVETNPPPSATTEDVKEEVTETPEDAIQTQIEGLITVWKEEQERVKTQLARLRVLERSFSRLKVAFNKKYNGLASTLEKKTKRKATEDGKPKAKSGFSKPATISDELAEFMKLLPGSTASRTEATKAVIQYVKTHGLESAENRRQWNPDETLHKLLKPEKFIKEGEHLGYFNVQRTLSQHFPKA